LVSRWISSLLKGAFFVRKNDFFEGYIDSVIFTAVILINIEGTEEWCITAVNCAAEG
jgi:hypothetical protein